MRLTRREFVSDSAIGLAALALPTFRAPSGNHSRARCAVLDLGVGCAFYESVIGYRRATAGVVPRIPTLIVPAALTIPRQTIEGHLWRGGLVILESGAVFANEREFASHREELRSTLQLHVDQPRALWPRPTPYVHFHWPMRIMVRDFSAVVPVDWREGQVIAAADGLPVALLRRARLGQLVFLGSLLGPALWAGDEDAARWLRSLLQNSFATTAAYGFNGF